MPSLGITVTGFPGLTSIPDYITKINMSINKQLHVKPYHTITYTRYTHKEAATREFENRFLRKPNKLQTKTSIK